MLTHLKDAYVNNPDAGIHSSIEWLLRQWRLESEIKSLQEELRGKPAGPNAWVVNKQGQTLVIIPEVQKFMMGSPEPGFPEERGHWKGIPRSYAIGTKEVTVAQFKEFLKSGDAAERRVERDTEKLLEKYSPVADGPMIQVDWFRAAAYCNWLSKQEGLPASEWCYPDKIEKGMEMPKGFLERKGYRLPTEAEWEYACRAGATTSRFYGRDRQLLEKYAWYSKTTESLGAQPVGLMKPNDLGLFDVYGNVWEWCQGTSTPPTRLEKGVSDDREQEKGVLKKRILSGMRGGAFLYPETECRSAYRYSNRASLQIRTLGFRVARTCP